MNRRQFLRATAAGFPLALASCGSSPAEMYDLVIRGGRVIDPSQTVGGAVFDQTADVAIREGLIAAIEPNIPPAAALQSIDATGKLVVPGLIDVHLHARDAALPPSEILSTGVTTMVDGGSRGADNVDQILEIARNAPNRLRLLLNIARLGNNPDGRAEFLDGLEPADVDKARAAVEQNRNWIIGIKARLSRGVAGDLDLAVLGKALEVADPLGIPIMIHIGDTASTMPQILAMLRPGDIVTHLYAPTPNGIMDANGRVLQEVREARSRGVRFDFGNGLNEHWDWDFALRALEQDFPPDTISTDLSVNGRMDQVFNLPNVLSKFLLMGMPLDQVLACVTSNASRAFPELNPYGSLRLGAAADVTVLELADGEYEFTDNYKGARMGTQKLFTRNVVFGGQQIV